MTPLRSADTTVVASDVKFKRAMKTYKDGK
jgi:hypothetical protein